MFKSVIQLLLPESSRQVRANYFYFEDAKKEILEQASKLQEAIGSDSGIEQGVEQSVPIMTQEEKYQKAFYDFLFGQSPPSQQHDELSLFVASKIEQLLSAPKQILTSLPTLPMSLSNVLVQMNDEDFDTDLLVTLIQREPAIAAKVIELANSSFYNRSDKAITDLKSAFMLLGVNGLMEGVINGFVSNLAPQSQLYFKQYGNHIWKHSFSTGVIAKTLVENSARKQDSGQAYLIGLICNLGDMIIFQLLMEAFSHVHPDHQPNSFAFKDLMFKNSKVLTYYIAKFWHFPATILEALVLQTKLTQSAMLKTAFEKYPLGCFVYEANILSELELRLELEDLSVEELQEVSVNLVFSAQAKDYLNSKLLNSD